MINQGVNHAYNLCSRYLWKPNGRHPPFDFIRISKMNLKQRLAKLTSIACNLPSWSGQNYTLVSWFCRPSSQQALSQVLCVDRIAHIPAAAHSPQFVKRDPKYENRPLFAEPQRLLNVLENYSDLSRCFEYKEWAFCAWSWTIGGRGWRLLRFPPPQFGEPLWLL